MKIDVILAGVSGIRLEKSLTKQFFKVTGKMVIKYAVEAFEKNKLIDEIVIVNNHYLYIIEDMIIKNELKKVKRVLLVGEERYQSNLAAVKSYHEFKDASLIFHDAARPLISKRIINDVVKVLSQYKAVDVGMNSSDTIVEIENDIITDITERIKMRREQTPQSFMQKIIANHTNLL